MTRCGYWLCAAVLCSASAARAEQDRVEAERRLQALNQTIDETRASIEAARTDLAREQAALKAIDLEIQSNVHRQAELRDERAAHASRRAELKQEQEDHLDQLAVNREQLARQIRATWRLSGESRIKLILNQDSPAQLSRTLAYFDYFSRAQARRIGELRAHLEGLDRIAEQMAHLEAEMQRNAEALSQASQRLEKRRSERRQLAGDLAAGISSTAEQLAGLERDRADLEQLLQRLADALADIPADLGRQGHPATRRGQLPMPLDGRVLKAFGQPRGAGLAWRGWLIEARPGQDVRAVAYGRVAFADWLRGYGLLVIIDHGEGFMSLYGHNESLNFEIGDWVQPGQVIATSGGAGDAGDGLYFELRNAGRAVDPAVWIGRRRPEG